MNVFVLATCRNPALIELSTLVFKTIRVGFPSAHITAHLNRPLNPMDGIWDSARDSQVHLVPLFGDVRRHQDWIAYLINSQGEPFWIVDTDVIFFGNMERFEAAFHFPIAGAKTPRFVCPYTGLRTHARPHTSVMWIDPVLIREQVRMLRESFVKTPFDHCGIDLKKLVHPDISFQENGQMLHDTMSKLASVVGFDTFTEETLDCYAHLNCGTYSDLVDPTGGFTSRNLHLARNPDSARGLWREQANFRAGRSW